MVQGMIFEFWNGKRLRKEIFSRSWWRRKMAWNAKLQNWRTMEFYCRSHGYPFPRQRTSILQSLQCVGSGILQKERAMYDSLQCGSFECRSFISHDQFCKSAQCLRSSCGLVWWIWLSRFLVILFQARRNPSRKWTSNYIENWSLRKWIRWYRHLGRMFKQREIDCVFIKKDLKERFWCEIQKATQICESAAFIR